MTGAQDGTFTVVDLEDLTDLVSETWTSGGDRDWTVPAGTLEWTCWRTASHVVDTTFAPAFFLASRRLHAYPPFTDLRALPGASVPDLVDGLRAASTILAAVIRAAEPGTRAVIRRFPTVVTAPPADFAPRGALEMIIHTHDIATGLGLAFDPPDDLCGRLYEHTESWPREAVDRTGDQWSDLLASRGRARPG